MDTRPKYALGDRVHVTDDRPVDGTVVAITTRRGQWLNREGRVSEHTVVRYTVEVAPGDLVEAAESQLSPPTTRRSLADQAQHHAARFPLGASDDVRDEQITHLQHDAADRDRP